MPSKRYQELLKNFEKEFQDRQAKLRNLVTHGDLFRAKESTETEIKLQGLKEYYEMRRTWGSFLMKCLAVILGFNIGLIILVGFGWLKYSDEWFLRVVLTTNLADVIGLVYLVVKFLFSNQTEDKDKKIPKN